LVSTQPRGSKINKNVLNTTSAT